MRLVLLRLVPLLLLAACGSAAAEEGRCTADVVAALRRSSAPEAGRDILCRQGDRLPDLESEYSAERDIVLEGLTVSQAPDDPIGEMIDDLERPPAPDLSTPKPRPTFMSAPDGQGGYILQDQAGRIYSPPTDNQGNSTFYTDDGQIMRCHTSEAGVTTCD